MPTLACASSASSSKQLGHEQRHGETKPDQATPVDAGQVTPGQLAPRRTAIGRWRASRRWACRAPSPRPTPSASVREAASSNNPAAQVDAAFDEGEEREMRNADQGSRCARCVEGRDRLFAELAQREQGADPLVVGVVVVVGRGLAGADPAEQRLGEVWKRGAAVPRLQRRHQSQRDAEDGRVDTGLVRRHPGRQADRDVERHQLDAVEVHQQHEGEQRDRDAECREVDVVCVKMAMTSIAPMSPHRRGAAHLQPRRNATRRGEDADAWRVSRHRTPSLGRWRPRRARER